MSISAAALQYFVALADELHFTRAAERLHLTVPSLSQQISRLERQVGQRLFDRSPRGVRLTAAGEELLPLATEAVRAHGAVVAWAQHATAPLPPLRVGIVASGAGDLTSEILTGIVERFPQLRLQLVRLGFLDAVPALERHTVDLAITLAPLPPSDRVVARPLLTEPRVLVIRADHPLAQHESLTIDQTNDLGFVVPSEAAGDALAWWLVDPRPDGSRPRVVAQADGVEGLMELCAAGIGVNIATRSVATQFGRPGLAYLDLTDIEPAQVLLVRAVNAGHPAVPDVERIASRITAGRFEVSPALVTSELLS